MKTVEKNILKIKVKSCFVTLKLFNSLIIDKLVFFGFKKNYIK